MPPLHMHVNLVRLVLEGAQERYDGGYVVAGAIAPDCFDRTCQQSFRIHHFSTDRTEVDLAYFLQATKPSRASADRRVVSFVFGYRSHLWLDGYMRLHGGSIPVCYPDGTADDEKRELLRANIEYYDLLDIAALMPLASPSPLEAIAGLEFVSFDAVAHQWSALVASADALHDRASPRLVVTKGAFAGFLQEAVDQYRTSA